MKNLIIYFSRSGHNHQLAEELAKKIGADTAEIVDKNPKGFMMSGWQSMKKKNTDIKPIKKDITRYDQLILVSPLWFGGPPPATRTFIEQHLNHTKQFACLSVSGNGIKNDYYLDNFEKEFSLKIAPRLLISNTEFAEKTYKKQLTEFAKKL